MRNAAERSGFTLVEIMIVVMIIGLLVALAIPSFYRARMNSQNVAFMNDLRIATAAFEQYALDHTTYPPDNTPGIIPPGMVDYLSHMHWTENTPIGGQWDWDCGQFGVKAGVSVYFGSAMQDTRMSDIDAKIDDGDLSAGRFRKRANGYINIIEY